MDATYAGSDDLTGVVVGGKYRLVRPLGHGLVGTVYLAQCGPGDAWAALKVVHPELTRQPRTMARFLRETHSAARLQHPNVVRILEAREDVQQRLLYLALDYIDGRDLDAVIAQDWPLTDNQIVEIMSQVLSALSAAHALGIVHRDLKPTNILLSAPEVDGDTDYQVSVCDFEIAQLAPGTVSGAHKTSRPSSVATDCVLVGTADYASPEHLRGESSDARSDIYAAGVVLFQLLTRTLPFVAATPFDVALKHCGTPPPPPSGFGRVNAALEAACLKALSKTPGARFQNASEMRAAIEAARTHESAASRSRRRRSLSSRPSVTEGVPEVVSPQPKLEARLSIVPSQVTQPLVEPHPQALTQPRPTERALAAPRSNNNVPHLQLARVDPYAAAVAELRQMTSLAPVEREVPREGSRHGSHQGSRDASIEEELDIIPKQRSALAVLSSIAIGLTAWAVVARYSAIESSRVLHEQVVAAVKTTIATTPTVRHVPNAITLILPPAETLQSGQASSAASQGTTAEATDSHPTEAAVEPGTPAKVEPLALNGPSLASTRPKSLPETLPALIPNVSASAPPTPPPTPPRTRSEASSAPPPSAASQPAQSVRAREHLAQRAYVTVGTAFAKTRVPSANLRAAIDRIAMTECYQAVLIQAGGPQSPIEARLDIETDESGRITFAGMHAAQLPKALRGCVEHVARAGRVPDIGHVEASVNLTFALN